MGRAGSFQGLPLCVVLFVSHQLELTSFCFRMWVNRAPSPLLSGRMGGLPHSHSNKSLKEPDEQCS